MVGNKSDFAEERKVSFEEAKEYVVEHDLSCIEISAKEGININELFESSIESFLSNNKYIGGDKNIKLNNQSTTSEKNDYYKLFLL